MGFVCKTEAEEREREKKNEEVFSENAHITAARKWQHHLPMPQPQ
jgi:hypothetical protein